MDYKTLLTLVASQQYAAMLVTTSPYKTEQTEHRQLQMRTAINLAKELISLVEYRLPSAEN